MFPKKAIRVTSVAIMIALMAASPVMAKTPGCVGKMWNPITDLDYRLLGGIKIAGAKILPDPELGAPPGHEAESLCYCERGSKSGWGLGLTYWMPSYINDLARQAGCLGALGGLSLLKQFISLSSTQEYSPQINAKGGATNMHVHWLYADILQIAGKSLFEKCDNVETSMQISYMSEIDPVINSDVLSIVMTPQATILARSPMVSLLVCGAETIRNTLGDWTDWNVCAWNGSRFPLSNNSIGQTSAQVTNMDVTIKYLARNALLGLTMRTIGDDDVTCRPEYSPIYLPFQHRYQWAFPVKTATRYNIDFIRWGMFISNKDGSSSFSTFVKDYGNADQINKLSTFESKSGGVPDSTLGGLVTQVLDKLPKPLHYPTHESGYMQVWEGRQCCLVVFTVIDLVTWAMSAFTSDSTIKEVLKVYNTFNTAKKFYDVAKGVKDLADTMDKLMSGTTGMMNGAVGSATTAGDGYISGAAGMGMEEALTGMVQ